MSNGLNRASWKYAFAYTGIVVGAGFATGQEVLQFFTSYGLISIVGAILTGLIVMFVGTQELGNLQLKSVCLAQRKAK